MIEATPEYLLNIVDEATAFKIWESLEGMRIYFPKGTIKHHNIKQDFKLLIDKHYLKLEAIKELSYCYEMSESQIRRVIAKGDIKPLFGSKAINDTSRVNLWLVAYAML